GGVGMSAAAAAAVSAAAAAAAGGGGSGGGGGVPLSVLEQCVRLGQPVLLEDVGEGPLDPALEPLLTKATYMQGSRLLIRLGDVEVDYDPRFRLYLTTRLPNPHYLPEVCIKVNLINFTVTPKGLEDQLLGDVVRQERPDLEEAKDRLVVSLSADKRQLSELEDRILALLKEAAPASLLDDEQLIATLNNAKQTSGIIQTRVAEAEATERAINEAREVYRPVPTRGSLLYFVTAELSLIDPMYQTSLAAFVRMFRHCLDTAAHPADDLGARLQCLMDHTTDYVYRMVCRGLFDSHKLLYSFLIATSIGRHSGAISHAEWSFLLRGGRGASSSATASHSVHGTLAGMHPSGSVGGASAGAGAGPGAPSSAAMHMASLSGSGDTPSGTQRPSSTQPYGGLPPPPRPAGLGSWAGPGVWEGVLALEAAVPAVFAGLAAAVAAKPEGWQAFAESPTPDTYDLSSLFTPPPPPPPPPFSSASPSITADGSSSPSPSPPLARIHSYSTPHSPILTHSPAHMSPHAPHSSLASPVPMRSHPPPLAPSATI
ncbi:hypothetical protein Agub_g3174, partial [Astrephomene gubernaculifera]